MDNIGKNEMKQIIKVEFDTIIKETMLIVLEKYNIPPFLSEKIIKDLCIWSNMSIDANLN